jgi:hypothetical protein
MKNTIILLLMALSAPLIHSSTPTNVSEEIVNFEAPCYNTKVLLNELKNTYKETPIVVGKANDVAESTMTLWVNPLNDSWTIVATKKDLSCVIGTGTHFKIMPLKKSISI